MAKMKLKFEPGVLPRSSTEITREYILDYIAYGVKAGEIKAEALAKWIKDVEAIEADTTKSQMKKYAGIRSLFVNTFMTSLKAKKAKNMSDFFKTLKASE